MSSQRAARSWAQAAESVAASGVRPDAARYDLQGLRGIGVLLVVVGHLWFWPQGAFGALDVFFVLSGYFITGILVDRHRAHGRWELKEFYAGRLRRLLPTALTVIVATILLTRLLYSPARARPVVTEGFWAAVFGSNWYFADRGVDYFADLQASPLLHYWSLSLEEQFYLVWPWLLVLVVALAARRTGSATRALVGLVSALVVVSFAYSLWHSAAHPTAAYFSTFDRVWEFAAGGLLALGRPVLARLSATASRALSWTGLALMAITLFVLRYGMAFPAPWGLLPVITCCVLIAAGVSGRVQPPRLLTNLPMVYLGTISYSLYLWHMPVKFLLRSVFLEDTTVYRFTAFAAALVVGALSFHLIERPARRAPWLMTSRERERIRGKAPLDWRRVQAGWGVALVGVAGTLVLGTSLHVHNERVAAAQSIVSSTPSTSPSAPPAERGERASRRSRTLPSLAKAQSERVAQALEATSFPAFSPPLRELSFDRWVDAIQVDGCTNVTLASAGKCRYGSATDGKTAVVIGDSFATAWTPGIRAALEPEGWSVQQFTLFQCPTWTMPTYYRPDGTPYGDCTEHHDQMLQLLRDVRPRLLVVTSSGAPYQAYQIPARTHEAPADFAREGLGRTLRDVVPLARRTVVLEPPATHGDLQQCVTRFSKPADCVTAVPDDYVQTDAGEEAASEDHGATYVATRDWFCKEDRCPAFMGTTPVTAEGHLTVEFARSLGDLLRASLLS